MNMNPVQRKAGALMAFAACVPLLASHAHAAIITVGQDLSILATALVSQDGIDGKATDGFTAHVPVFNQSVSAAKSLPSSAPLMTATATSSMNFVNAIPNSMTASGLLRSEGIGNCFECSATGESEASVGFTFQVTDEPVDYTLTYDFGTSHAGGVSGLDSFVKGTLELTQIGAGPPPLYAVMAQSNSAFQQNTSGSKSGTLQPGHSYQLDWVNWVQAAQGSTASSDYSLTLTFGTPVPLPAAAWLLASGLGVLVPLVRRRRATRAAAT